MGHIKQDYVRFIEQTLEDAKAEGCPNMTAALNILLEDAYKWTSEYEAGALDRAALSSEIACLYEFAREQVSLGEQHCDPETVRGYLTV